ncbi:MAG TPA: S8 family peptidase [Gemmatimonadaceae bacterium]|nr:S8 family peptidase [Gemmatimonadaceae bacterium]
MHSPRIAVTLVALSALAACGDAPSTAAPTAGLEAVGTAPLHLAAKDKKIEGQYIVVFADGVEDPDSKALAKAQKHAAKLKHSYKFALKGFAAELTPEAVEALRQDPDVAYIEEDQEVTIDATQSNATWGIDRIDQRSRPLSTTYTYTATASGVNAYIIDTGILTAHSEFGGRASAGYDAFGGNGQDCNGHGTHVAGTVGGTVYGVAKEVRLYGVRVLNCSGSGSNSGVIAGMDWVRANHRKPAVANMSLGGGYSSATNTAANNLASAGVFLAVAAGNSNANACNYSPASAANATAVAASTSSDAKASYSNYGSCVDVYAPGSSIRSAWYTSTTATNTISGTSMASPHVAGVGALYKATYGDASYSTIRTWIVNNATASVITGNPSGTPNRLLYKGGL